MAIIYVITNEKNGKQYVGATRQSIEKRWKIHEHDMNRDRCRHRQLYSAMREYGKDNFSIKEIETVRDDERFDREKYWIGKLNTYRNGYNETVGGSGTEILDKALNRIIEESYRRNGDIKNTAKDIGLDTATIKRSLLISGNKIKTSKEIMVERKAIPVEMLSVEGEHQMTFESINAAAKYIVKCGYLNGNTGTARQHIREVCAGKKRKTAAKHKWRFAER